MTSCAGRPIALRSKSFPRCALRLPPCISCEYAVWLSKGDGVSNFSVLKFSFFSLHSKFWVFLLHSKNMFSKKCYTYEKKTSVAKRIVMFVSSGILILRIIGTFVMTVMLAAAGDLSSSRACDPTQLHKAFSVSDCAPERMLALCVNYSKTSLLCTMLVLSACQPFTAPPVSQDTSALNFTFFIGTNSIRCLQKKFSEALNKT